MTANNHHKHPCQPITQFQIRVFCHECGKDDFGGNTRSLSSHVWYCKTSKITISRYNTRRKHHRDNVDHLFHDSGTDPFSFLVRKGKDCHQSINLELPKTKEGHVGICGSEASLLLDDTRNGEVGYLTDDLQNSATNAVTAPESYQVCSVDTSSTPTEESELPFDLEEPIPGNCQFQLDLLTILSQHCTDLKLHDEIITVIKSHSNEIHLNFMSNNLKSRSPLLKDLERNMETAKIKPKDVVVDLTICGQATVSIFDLEAMIMSFLTDPTLMQPKNIAHGYNIFTGKSVGCQ
jgi:hypothetical protein